MLDAIINPLLVEIGFDAITNTSSRWNWFKSNVFLWSIKSDGTRTVIQKKNDNATNDSSTAVTNIRKPAPDLIYVIDHDWTAAEKALIHAIFYTKYSVTLKTTRRPDDGSIRRHKLLVDVLNPLLVENGFSAVNTQSDQWKWFKYVVIGWKIDKDRRNYVILKENNVRASSD